MLLEGVPDFILNVPAEVLLSALTSQWFAPAFKNNTASPEFPVPSISKTGLARDVLAPVLVVSSVLVPS